MLSEFSPFEPEVEKEGVLSKQGGGAGGTKNWKDRYFVLTDHLYYYGSKAEYAADPQNPLGRVNLLSFYVSRSDESTHEFCVHAYPKVRLGMPRCGAHCGPSTSAHPAPTPPPLCNACPSPVAQSLTCRAGSKSELDDWVAAIMAPLDKLRQVNVDGRSNAARGGAVSGAQSAGGGGGREKD